MTIDELVSDRLLAHLLFKPPLEGLLCDLALAVCFHMLNLIFHIFKLLKSQTCDVFEIDHFCQVGEELCMSALPNELLAPGALDFALVLLHLQVALSQGGFLIKFLFLSSPRTISTLL